ncbi:SMK killer toxin resistance protein [Podospora bellae-mahoneyi]|uniref:SMK killer toxin resistance protein n=1 Tax=Podospora bellae-mahoneyi TaxID=2093777 RepID=A0ABR0G1B2_9PEZI|nr:SMK killer toxin resistance protein [Podospora bellae-mahoneyi]
MPFLCLLVVLFLFVPALSPCLWKTVAPSSVTTASICDDIETPPVDHHASRSLRKTSRPQHHTFPTPVDKSEPIIMASFFQNLWESIFTPGPTPTLLVATNVTFAALQVVLAAMLLATYSIHFIILSGICAGLWMSINWFAGELIIHQIQEEEKARKAKAAQIPTSSDDSETEVEASKSTASLGKGKKPTPEAAAVSTVVEPAENQGELKLRVPVEEPGSSQGLKSGVSTEDEWEKVSENENEKEK